MIKKLNSLLTKRDKQVLVILLIFSILLSIIETIGVGAIMPFIKVASDFSEIHKGIFKKIYDFFGFKSDIDFVVVFGVVLIGFYIFRAVFSYLYFYFLARFSQGRFHLIAFRLFENYLGLPYYQFISKNSSEMIKNITQEASHLVQLISNFLFMISEIFVAIFIYSFLLYINWKMTILLTLFLGVNIFILKLTVSRKIKKAGELREEFQKSFYKILNTSIGNFKIIKLKSSEDKILQEFNKASFGFAKANIKNASLSQVPRLFLEALGFTLLAIIVIYLVLKYNQDIRGALPILMAFILGLYRLMPSMNRILHSYNQILFYSKSLEIIHNELIYEVEDLGDEEIEFNKKIECKDVSFEYIEGKKVLDSINLEIKKGESVGFVGSSGSGKSTLIDILSGLYKPKEGKILIDGVELNEKNVKSWRKKIGYIPQNIYLVEGSVAENVAFGEAINEERVKEALKKANILEFLETHHEGIYTQVGDNGIKLSGGQKQRIAIARALYNDPEILVLDEATSALDNATEAKIMEEIYKVGENKTLLIIAHRLSTLDNCDKIVKLENGKIKEIICKQNLKSGS